MKKREVCKSSMRYLILALMAVGFFSAPIMAEETTVVGDPTDTSTLTPEGQQEAQQAVKDVNDLEKEIESTSKEITNTEKELSDLNKDIASLDTQISNNQNTLDNLNSQKSSIDTQVSAANTEVARLEVEAANAKKQLDKGVIGFYEYLATKGYNTSNAQKIFQEYASTLRTGTGNKSALDLELQLYIVKNIVPSLQKYIDVEKNDPAYTKYTKDVVLDTKVPNVYISPDITAAAIVNTDAQNDNITMGHKNLAKEYVSFSECIIYNDVFGGVPFEPIEGYLSERTTYIRNKGVTSDYSAVSSLQETTGHYQKMMTLVTKFTTRPAGGGVTNEYWENCSVKRIVYVGAAVRFKSIRSNGDGKYFSAFSYSYTKQKDSAIPINTYISLLENYINDLKSVDSRLAAAKTKRDQLLQQQSSLKSQISSLSQTLSNQKTQRDKAKSKKSSTLTNLVALKTKKHTTETALLAKKEQLKDYASYYYCDVRNNVFDWSFTGFAKNPYDSHAYVYENGIVNLLAKGVYDYEMAKTKVYVQNGRIANTFKGLAKASDQKWYYFENGTFKKNFTGVSTSDVSSNLFAVRNSVLDWNYTGILKNHKTGKWMFCRKGQHDAHFTGVAKSVENGKWYHCKNGILDWNFTGLSKSVENGKYYFSRKGALDWKFTGVAKSITNGKWYFARKGVLDWNFTGVAKSVENGKWYAVNCGALSWKGYGLYKSVADGRQYFVRKGTIDWKYTGSVTNGKNNYFIRNGRREYINYSIRHGNEYWTYKNGVRTGRYTLGWRYLGR